MLTRSFGLVIIMMGLLFIFFFRMLPDLFKIITYKIKNRGEPNDNSIGENEQPVLELEFDSDKLFTRRVGAIIFLLLLIFGFFTASSGARHDLHSLFPFLNEKQTYILYYCAWKFDSFFMLVWLGPFGIIGSFNKRVLFFKKYVILDNRLTGLKKFTLNSNVRLSKTSSYCYILYDQQTGAKTLVLYRKTMKFDDEQEKLLEEYLRKIPVKKRYFYI